MANEIRDLEDQLYEYDHQYRLLEQELESLRRQNQQLHAAPQVETPSKRSNLSPPPLKFQPRSSSGPISPGPMLDAEELPMEPESILESTPPASDELPAPSLDRSNPPSTDTLPTLPNNLQTDKAASESASPNLPAFPPATQPNLRDSTPRAVPSEEDIDAENIMPPPIEFGTPMPPPLPAVTKNADGELVAPENSLEMNLSRIEVPSRLASTSSTTQATIQVASEKPTDTRVVELAFHPTLSRAINIDDRPDDDGIYLVLLPKNERGQMVPVSAELTIFALDPSREADKAQIGRWEYSAEDVKAKLQPIGSEQGIHFRLPWNGPDPGADRVVVFALYKFENGRQVMGQKEIFVSSDGSRKTVWTPRGTQGANTDEVVTASFGEPVHGDSQTSGQSNRVIRSASDSIQADAAPQPYR